mmetsp:Transcript_42275/g.119558  ORF Transcript_42275/g.119558 Transcript_42275/m.119558 type:complete len:223 (-) Transcript_42275:1292-1960(-)
MRRMCGLCVCANTSASEKHPRLEDVLHVHPPSHGAGVAVEVLHDHQWLLLVLPLGDRLGGAGRDHGLWSPPGQAAMGAADPLPALRRLTLLGGRRTSVLVLRTGLRGVLVEGAPGFHRPPALSEGAACGVFALALHRLRLRLLCEDVQLLRQARLHLALDLLVAVVHLQRLPQSRRLVCEEFPGEAATEQRHGTLLRRAILQRLQQASIDDIVVIAGDQLAH